MKKVLSIILTVFCISITSLYTYADNENSNQCTVQIGVKKYPWQQGIERSLDQYVDAYLNLNSNTIEIDFSGLGEGEIYIIDQNNQVVNIAPIFAGDTYLIMNQPETTGYYTLIIISNEYYGEGYFCIE